MRNMVGPLAVPTYHATLKTDIISFITVNKIHIVLGVMCKYGEESKLELRILEFLLKINN